MAWIPCCCGCGVGWHLAWEPPYAVGEALESKKEGRKEEKKKGRKEEKKEREKERKTVGEPG